MPFLTISQKLFTCVMYLCWSRKLLDDKKRKKKETKDNNDYINTQVDCRLPLITLNELLEMALVVTVVSMSLSNASFSPITVLRGGERCQKLIQLR